MSANIRQTAGDAITSWHMHRHKEVMRTSINRALVNCSFAENKLLFGEVLKANAFIHGRAGKPSPVFMPLCSPL
ncbi:hypothetical protein MOF34_08145 [Bacillus sp. T17B1]|uniref:hypothetical protein n=1 Tax=unclassified Bacillus (in: firmicutes) TaxID=185979 RepID=UPI00227E2D5C|nr:hypothetical protein [Bacillus sp. C28GYM-DRY-1]MCY9375109.1 hypothetical protein [Bacillus sp. T17B1]MDO3663013.1 hypothetical protein [Bacillus sp. C28GYM-DRY-1]